MTESTQSEALQEQIASLQHELHKARRKQAMLERALRERDEFLAMLGHELRKPLGAIGAAVALQQAVPVAEYRLARARAVIARQSAHMSRIVEDIFDLSRLARGCVQLRPELHDIGQLVRSTLDDFSELIARRSLHLDLELPSRPVWVLVDATRFSQVLANLLDNATKFTRSPGRVMVRVSSGGEPGAEHATIVVKDTGIGMDPQTAHSVFEPFQRQRRSDGSGHGLGVGLALVRALVELHDGSVEARSEGPGLGSEFFVRLPLAPQPAASLERQAADAQPTL